MPPYQTEWRLAGGVQANGQQVNSLKAGQHQLLVTDSQGQIAKAIFDLTNQEVDLAVDGILDCTQDGNGLVTITANSLVGFRPGLRYSLNGSGFQSENQFKVAPVDPSFVSIQNEDGCIYNARTILPAEECENLSIQELQLSIPDIATSFDGEIVEVPVLTTGFVDLNSINLALRWDEQVLDLISADLNEHLSDGFISSTSNTYNYAANTPDIVLNAGHFIITKV